MSSYEEMGPQQPKGWSPFAVALIATLVLLLGLGGALFGIYVANVNEQAAVHPTPQQEAVKSPQPGLTTPATTPPVTSTPTTPPVTATATTETFPLPNLVGLNFVDARAKVRALKLGWALKFGATGSDPTVTLTDPAPGAAVYKGLSVVITVNGAAPLAHVPAITDEPCDQAVNRIIDAGLYPDYGTSARTGTVLPGPTMAALHWNDQMPITCSG